MDIIERMNKMKSIHNHGKCKLQQLANLKPSLFGETFFKDAHVVSYTKWDECSMGLLLERLKTFGNYDWWWNVGGKNAKDGSIKPNGKKKENLFSSMMFFLARKEVHYNYNQVKNKIAHLEKQHCEVMDFLCTIGEGLNNIDHKMGIINIKDKIFLFCSLTNRIEPFMGDWASTNPPFVSHLTNYGVDVE